MKRIDESKVEIIVDDDELLHFLKKKKNSWCWEDGVGFWRRTNGRLLETDERSAEYPSRIFVVINNFVIEMVI